MLLEGWVNAGGQFSQALFQSFLYWICYWKFHQPGNNHRHYDSVSILLILDMLLEVRRGQLRYGRNSKFQSFLYWICYWKELADIEKTTGLSKFQSFLYWICYWKPEVGRKRALLWMRFNPSYTGYATGSGGRLYCTIEGANVSILLILDMLLEDWVNASLPAPPTGFNPSYTGYATGSWSLDASWLNTNYGFNPSYTGYATGSSDLVAG